MLTYTFKSGYVPCAKIVIQAETHEQIILERNEIIKAFFPETQVHQWKDVSALYPAGKST